MPGPSPPLSLIGYGVFIVGAISLMATSIVTTYWITFEDIYSHPLGHAGLFKLCPEGGKCEKYSGMHKEILLGEANYDDVKTVRGLCITALVLYILTLLGLGHLLFVDKMKPKSRNHGWISLFMTILAALFAFSGCIHFSNQTGFDYTVKLDWSMGYSLYLAAVSGVASVGAGILFLIASHTLYRVGMPSMQPAIYSTYPAVAPIPPVQQQHQPIMAVPQQYNAYGQPQPQPQVLMAYPPQTGITNQGLVADQKPNVPPPPYMPPS